MALPAKSLSLKINFKKWQVFIFSKDIYTIVKYTKSFEKNLHKVLSSIKILKLLQGLVGFGNLRFAEIKSCPSASPTYELRKVEISCQKWLFMHILCCKLCPPEHNKSGTNFFINGFDPPPPVYNNYKKNRQIGTEELP